MSMLPNLSRQKELLANYDRIANVIQTISAAKVDLVAVSKLKPVSDILTLYNHGVRHFGENYVQELVTKSQQLPKDIQWHFIGLLQTDKCKVLAKQITNLYAVETIDSLKKCKKLNACRKEVNQAPVKVFLQINTSREEQKSGYSLDNLSAVYETVEYLISEECDYLTLEGLMTIGSLQQSTSGDGNHDFEALIGLRDQLNEKYGLSLRTSMGMSNDYQEAIRQGSSSVRVGSSIFGSRPPKII